MEVDMKQVEEVTKTFHRIVVGVDGSKASAATLAWAASQAAITGSRLDVLTTWEWPTGYTWSIPIPSDFDPQAETQQDIDGIVKTVVDAHPDLVIQTHVVEGHPALTLVEASHEADLLVVGSTGHGEFAGLLLGSVSDYCVHHARSPVVVVR
jgi:nucleotide-binding universal stress UspA family protein